MSPSIKIRSNRPSAGARSSAEPICAKIRSPRPLRAKYRAALAAYDQARLAYEQKVLEVFREVNDAVTAYRNMRRTAELKFNLKEAARQYVVLAKLQYINGVIRYIDVLDAQRKFFDAQVEESKAVRNEHLALVGLYKALGGGWQPSDAEKKG